MNQVVKIPQNQYKEESEICPLYLLYLWADWDELFLVIKCSVPITSVSIGI